MARHVFGTAHGEVLLKLTSPTRQEASWSLKDGTALYENRALTNTLCQGLAVQGYLDEAVEDNVSTYTVNAAGRRRAQELRSQF